MVNKFFTLLALVLFPVLGSGQTSFKDGTVWKSVVLGTQDPSAEWKSDIVVLDGSETIGGMQVLRMFRSDELNSTTRSLIAYIRTDGDKVFFSVPKSDASDWFLMYDFGLKPGDGCYVYSLSDGAQASEPYRTYIKCVGIDGSDQDEGPHTMSLEEFDSETCNQSLGTGTWIKGVSSTLGVTRNNRFNADGSGSKLLEVSNGNEVIYSSSTTGIASGGLPSLEIKVNGTDVQICNIPEGERLSIYTTDGNEVGSCTATVGSTRISLPGSGVYIIKVGGKVMKLHI